MGAVGKDVGEPFLVSCQCQDIELVHVEFIDVEKGGLTFTVSGPPPGEFFVVGKVEALTEVGVFSSAEQIGFFNDGKSGVKEGYFVFHTLILTQDDGIIKLMNMERMWICACLDEKSREEAVSLAKKANEELRMSERFLDFPLHVSLKRSFYADRFEEVSADLKELMNGYERMYPGKCYLFRNRDMLWLRFGKEEELLTLHRRIDALLEKKYGIPVDEFDRLYAPHVTLFRDDNEMKLDRMYEMLKDCVRVKPCLDSYYIGSVNRENRFFALGKKEMER